VENSGKGNTPINARIYQGHPPLSTSSLFRAEGAYDQRYPLLRTCDTALKTHVKIESRLNTRFEDDVGYESVRYWTIGMILENLPISRDDVFFGAKCEMVKMLSQQNDA
jgi:hypothetical protein